MKIIKNALFLFILCLCLVKTQAQDSLSIDSYDIHKFKTWQCVGFSGVVTTGFVISATPSLHENIDLGIQKLLNREDYDRHEFEDWIQYAPISSVYILKACGLDTYHNWRDLTNLGICSYVLGTVLTYGTKYTTLVERPYDGVFGSFPSGHTFTAFVGAEMLRREFGKKYPVIGFLGYLIATGVGFMRIYNNRHWLSDVVGGAGFGILSTSFTYWLAPYLKF